MFEGRHGLFRLLSWKPSKTIVHNWCVYLVFEMGDNANDERIGVLIGKCDLEKHPLVCQPRVTVEIVDSRTGQSLTPSTDLDGKSNVAVTQPFCAVQKRSQSPCWDEILTCNFSFQDICNSKNSHYLLLFEISDDVQESSSSLSIFKIKQRDVVKVRVAWAFLKPVAVDGSLNVDRQLRLQLYKVGRKCATSHHTCPVFHLYRDHKRKKYPGSLYVELRGIKPTKQHKDYSTPYRPSSEVIDVPSPLEHPKTKVTISATEWSRLPTQSCKIPNSKYADVPVGRRGASCVVFSHSGSFLACGSFAKLVLFDVREKREVGRLGGHSGLIYEINWSLDDLLLLSVSADCSAMVWSVKPLKKTPLFVLPHPSFVYCGKWLGTNKHLVSGGKDSTIRYWEQGDVGFELLEEVRGHIGFISALETRGDTLMFSGDSQGQVIMWTLKTGKWMPSRKFNLREIAGYVVDAIHLHPGQRRIVVSARTYGAIMLDVSAGAAVLSYRARSLNARSVSCLTPCGSLLFSFSPKNHINIWEFDTGNLIATFKKVFPDIGQPQTEVSGFITYHPWEHLVAVAVLGCNYPVMLLNYNYRSTESLKLGLTMKSTDNTTDKANDLTVFRMKTNEKEVKSPDMDNHSTEDKLATIVRNIDRVLQLKREVVAHASTSSFQKFEN